MYPFRRSHKINEKKEVIFYFKKSLSLKSFIKFASLYMGR